MKERVAAFNITIFNDWFIIAVKGVYETCWHDIIFCNVYNQKYSDRKIYLLTQNIITSTPNITTQKNTQNCITTTFQLICLINSSFQPVGSSVCWHFLFYNWWKAIMWMFLYPIPKNATKMYVCESFHLWQK